MEASFIVDGICGITVPCAFLFVPVCKDYEDVSFVQLTLHICMNFIGFVYFDRLVAVISME